MKSLIIAVLLCAAVAQAADPRYGLYSAVTRKGKDGYQFSMTEAVPIAEAIRLYTAMPPFLTWEEKQKGTLEPGKLADLIVLDRDP